MKNIIIKILVLNLLILPAFPMKGLSEETSIKKNPYYQVLRHYIQREDKDFDIEILEDRTPTSLEKSPFKLFRIFTQGAKSVQKLGTDVLLVNEKIAVKPIALPQFIKDLNYTPKDENEAYGLAQICVAINSNMSIYVNKNQIPVKLPFKIDQQLNPPIITKTLNGFNIVLFTVYKPDQDTYGEKRFKITKYNLTFKPGSVEQVKEIIFTGTE